MSVTGYVPPSKLRPSTALHSCLYECQVMHRRFTPKNHQFLYRIFMFAVDLDELETLHHRLLFFSLNRRNLYSFRETDFLPTSEPIYQGKADAATKPGAKLKERVLAYLAAHGLKLEHGRIMLVTLPRVLGYLFNPVSFYFCFDADDRPVAVITEVTNTFREMKPFFLGTETRAATTNGQESFRLRTPKHFYVSPFSDVDLAFDFTLRVPAERLLVQIDDYEGPLRTLTSTLSGIRTPLSNVKLAWLTLKYPFITLKIIMLIHWHAFLLYCKKIPWYRKSARSADQRGLYRPHTSIAPATKP